MTDVRPIAPAPATHAVDADPATGAARSHATLLTPLLEASAAAIPQVEHAAVTLVSRGATSTVAVSDELAGAAQAALLEAADGPVPAAVRTGLSVVSDDLAGDLRWPCYTSAVLRLGVRAELAVPLHHDERTFGALVLYWTSPHDLDVETLTLAHAFAEHAAATIALGRKVEHLQYALQTRQLIGQATGMLMERYDMSADSAFNYLRRRSQTSNVKLRDVALELVERRRLPDLAGEARDR